MPSKHDLSQETHATAEENKMADNSLRTSQRPDQRGRGGNAVTQRTFVYRNENEREDVP